MNQRATLRCRCGKVRGEALEIAPAKINRAICYCDDCQAYLHELGCTELLDRYGGTDIVQMAPALVRIEQGRDALQIVRLTRKGLYRMYAACCRTPLINAAGAHVPFVGVVVSALEPPAGYTTDALLGPAVGIFGKFAAGSPPDTHQTASPKTMVRAIRLLLSWWVRGKGKPSPLFDPQTKRPVIEPRVVSPERRAELASRVQQAVQMGAMAGT